MSMERAEVEAKKETAMSDPEWFKWVFHKTPPEPPTDELLDQWRFECRGWSDAHVGCEQHYMVVILGLLEEIERLKVADIAARNPGIDSEQVRADREARLRERMREYRFRG